MRLLWLCNNVIGVNFWRMWQFHEKMKQMGMNSFMYGYDKANDSTIQRWQEEMMHNNKLRQVLYKIMTEADVIVMQYFHSPYVTGLMEMVKTEFKKKIWIEIDDLVLDVPGYNPANKQGSGWWQRGSINEQVVIDSMEMAHGVIVSTEALKEQYKTFNKNIHVIPNCINFKEWDIPVKKCSDKLRIGWAGGGNHNEDLEVIHFAIKELLEKYKNIEFMFVHGVPEYLKKLGNRVKYDLSWTNIHEYPKALASKGFDIGIAPLCYNVFNEGKSNLRYLEYSALKIPTVCTDIRPYHDTIHNKRNGLLCKNADDFIDNLSLLIEDEKRRKIMGEAAYRNVRLHYNLDEVTKKYKKILEGV